MDTPKRAVRQSLSVATALLAALACSTRTASIGTNSDASPVTMVTLEPVDDRVPATSFRGLHNIFFEDAPTALRDSLRVGAGWRGVQLADLIAEPGLRHMRVARFTQGESAEQQYVIDTSGALNLARAPVLTFERRGEALIANIDLTVQSKSGNERRVPYQIVVANDGYTYARITDYRIGRLRLDGQEYAVRVQNRSHGHPFYAVNAGTEFMIDLNGDGQFADRATVTVDGRPMSAEQVLAAIPFAIGSRLFELDAIDSAGTRLRLRPSNRAVAVAEGRRAPEVAAALLTGGVFRLSNETGKVVLLEFWATDCRHSEQVRVAANALVTKYGAGYLWVAIPMDTGRGALEEHLTKFPMRATVTMRDSAAWATYNARQATPVFVVVDERGIVRFRAEGASAFAAVEAKLDELLVTHP